MRDPAPAPADRLALLYRLSQSLNSTLDLDEVLERVMDEVIAAVGAERGFVMLRDEAGGLAFRTARGMDQRTIADPQFQVSRGVAERVAQQGRPVLTSDAQQDERFSMRQSVLDLRLRSILCVPLAAQDRLLGIIYVDNRLQAGLFSQADLDLLASIASTAAIAVENARLYQLAVEKGRLERELHMAREVQASLLPRQVPQLPGWEFAAHWRPARQVAGDYYDFIPLDEGRLGLVMADVSDKGMPAALFMATTRSVVRASVARAAWPSEGIALANRLICADAAGGMFVTLFYGLLHPATGVLAYVNAGHNPPLWYRASRDLLVPLERTGMALGVLEDAPLDQRAVRLGAGDWVLLYTDGLTDAVDARSDRFGLGRAQQVLLEHRHAPASEIVAALQSAVDRFTGQAPPFDDMAMVVARWLPKRE
jgi:sigma-B regulation protein RsbU (phosphoserine phosphatase)